MALCSAAMMSIGSLSGCGTAPANDNGTYASNVTGYGVVQSVEVVDRNSSSNNVLGTVGGAVVGGVLGHQIGGGTGNTVATVGGAAGGALAGNRLQNNMNGKQLAQAYKTTVRMDNGATETLMQENSPGVQAGDRVRVKNGAIVQRVR
jgi:outer membrane lipoprotein SlyB